MPQDGSDRWYSPAWYEGTRQQFLTTPKEAISNQLAGRAADESLEIEPAQRDEWRRSVELLQKSLGERIPILQEALMTPGCESVRHIILEFDFRRRGLRMDCVLLAEGVLFIIEFKRSQLERADRDQVMNYAVNLLEFHIEWSGLSGHSWPTLAHKPLECDRDTLSRALLLGLQNRGSDACVSASGWLDSPFKPSSSILDATLSLYGNHDVAAIQDHAAPKEAIDASTLEIRSHIQSSLDRGAYHIIFLSGAPGAGKTLVGLDIVMRGSHADEAVFVTGNAPLVDVLNAALGESYRAQGRRAASWTPTGYRPRMRSWWLPPPTSRS